MAYKKSNHPEHHILICSGSRCKNDGDEVTYHIQTEIDQLGLKGDIHTSRIRCVGQCSNACVAMVYPHGAWYRGVTPSIGRHIVQALKNGQEYPDNISHHFPDEGLITHLIDHKRE